MSQDVDRACLDFNLADGEVTPVLELLASKGVPMVVYTGRGLPKELTSQHPGLIVLLKPLPASRLVKELAKAKANCMSANARPVPLMQRRDTAGSSPA